MKLAVLAAVLVIYASTAVSADLCTPTKFQGPFGFQVSGDSTISGEPKPIVGVGRLIFDGTGALTGYSSVNFAGWLLGNPVTGRYEIRTDCSLVFSLQDESGNLQHFRGVVTGDHKSAHFRQTDAGGFEQGILVQTAADCTAGDVRPFYRFTINGFIVDMETGHAAGRVFLTGFADVTSDSSGKLTSGANSDALGRVSFYLEDGCFVNLELTLPEGSIQNIRRFRAILVNNGTELFGIATDPATAVKLHFAAPL